MSVQPETLTAAARVRDRLAELLDAPPRPFAPNLLAEQVRCAQALLHAIEDWDIEVRLRRLEEQVAATKARQRGI